MNLSLQRLLAVYIGNLGGHTPKLPNGLYLPTAKQIIALQTVRSPASEIAISL